MKDKICYTGKTCKRKGHTNGRYVSSNGCVSCALEYVLNNKEKRSLQENKRRKQNKERYNAYNKKYKQENKEIVRERSKQYYQQNKESIIEKTTKYYNTHLEEAIKRTKDWQKQNPKKVRNIRQRANIKRKQAIPLWEVNEREEINALYDLRDKLTKETGIEHVVDHIVPISGNVVCGLHTLCNLRVITEKENLQKGKKLIKELVEN